MRTAPTLTLSILTLASLEAAAALSATVPPAWLKAEVSLPEHSRSPLVVRLSPDMTPCRAKYGNEAASKCSRLFGLVSSRVTGVSLSPAVEGVWRWEARGALAFMPEEPWPERTAFKVDLSGLRLPSATTLNTPVIDFTTPPLTMTSGFATFWMDPAVSGERALTVDALFSTTIADTKAFEASVKVDVPSRSGLTFGKPVFIWNHFRTGFYMKLPVRTLGSATNVRITFPKAAGKWTAADGRHPVVQPGFRQAFVSYTIPAADSLYKMGEASLSPTRTETLEQVYELVLRPSLLTKPSDIVAAMRVTALPARMNEEAVSPTDWRRAPAVTPDVLARGTPVPVSIAQDPDTPSDSIRLLLKARPGDFLHLALPAGFGPEKSAVLSDGWTTVLAAADPGAAVGFLQPGSMMTLSGSRTLTLMADDVDRIRWRIERIRDPYLALTAQNWRAHETVTNAEALSEAANGIIPVAAGRRFASLPLDEAKLPGGRAGLFQITLTGEKKTKDGWGFAAITAKRVLVTDTALIAKTSRDGSHVVHAADLVRGVPAAGLRAVLLGANGVPLETVTTDETGAARFATTRGLEREKAPAAVVVTNEATGDLAWLSLSDASNVDHDHDFSTAGRLVSEDGLTGLVFSERGIYRPGETVHAGMIVKTADWHRLPAGMPVTLRITDAAGRTMLETAPALTPEGTASADWTIPTDAVPGEIRIDLLAGDVVLSTHHAAIGDFTPEAMRLTARMVQGAPGWMKPGDLGIDATLAMSYGAPAAKLPAGDADALRRDATARIQKALDTIEGQLGWNGLSAWPWGSPSLMATTWALDFVLTLRENGRDVRPELVRRLADAVGNALDGLTPDTLGQARTAAWALAQLTREGTLEAERIEALRNRMDARELDWRNDPAALYIAYAYRLMRLTDEADELQKAAISIDVSKSEGNDTLTLGGIPALASAVRLAPTPEGTAHLLQTLESRPLASLTDRERAFLASALLSAPSNGAQAGKLDAVTLACTAPAAEKRPAESLAKGDGFVTLSAPGCTAFRLSSAASLKGLYHSTTAAGWPAEPHKTASYEGLEVVKRILNEAGDPVTSVKAGDVVTVEIRARRTSGNAESPVVITDLFPGGFAPASTDESLQGLDVRQTAVSEDRMVGVCMLEHQESTFTYRLRAQTQGKYTVPAVQAADGADPTIKAHDKSLTLTVTP